MKSLGPMFHLPCKPFARGRCFQCWWCAAHQHFLLVLTNLDRWNVHILCNAWNFQSYSKPKDSIDQWLAHFSLENVLVYGSFLLEGHSIHLHLDRFLGDRVGRYLTPNPLSFVRSLQNLVFVLDSRHAHLQIQAHPETQELFFFFVCLSWSDIFACSPITAVQWIRFRKIWKYPATTRMGPSLWWHFQLPSNRFWTVWRRLKRCVLLTIPVCDGLVISAVPSALKGRLSSTGGLSYHMYSIFSFINKRYIMDLNLELGPNLDVMSRGPKTTYLVVFQGTKSSIHIQASTHSPNRVLWLCDHLYHLSHFSFWECASTKSCRDWHGSHPKPESSMQLPPGPSYLLRNFPYFAIPTIIAYACLTLANEYLSLAIPQWLRFLIPIFARPTVFILNRYYSRFADARNAAAHNAVEPPRVRGTALSLIFKMSRSRGGYPGVMFDVLAFLPKANSYALIVAASMLERTKEYGNTFLLRLLTDNRVRVFIPHPWNMKKPSLAASHGRTTSCQGKYFNQVVFRSDSVSHQGNSRNSIWCLWKG